MKKYMCYWGEGYDEQVALHPRSFFSEDSGYDEGALEEIDALCEGDTVDLSDLSGKHIVTCVFAPED